MLSFFLIRKYLIKLPQAYIYLIYDAYINNDDSKLESLLEDYSIYSSDPLLESSVLETKAYLSLNSGDYSKAIDLLNRSLKINNMDVQYDMIKMLVVGLLKIRKRH